MLFAIYKNASCTYHIWTTSLIVFIIRLSGAVARRCQTMPWHRWAEIWHRSAEGEFFGVLPENFKGLVVSYVAAAAYCVYRRQSIDHQCYKYCIDVIAWYRWTHLPVFVILIAATPEYIRQSTLYFRRYSYARGSSLLRAYAFPTRIYAYGNSSSCPKVI